MRSRVIWIAFGLCLVLLAAIVFLRVPQQGDRFTRLMTRGNGYLEIGDASNAITAYARAMELAPENIDVRLNLANAFLLAGDHQKVTEQCEQVLSLDHNAAAAYYLMGCAHLRLDQAEQAVQAFQQSQRIDPAVTALNFQLGLAQERLGHLEDAIHEFQAVIQYETNHLAAHYRLSQLYQRAGRAAEAAQALQVHQQILAANPNPPNDPAIFERCKYTQPRIAFALEQPERRGIPVRFVEATAAAFAQPSAYHGPVAVLDYNHEGRNSLFVMQGDGFRLLANQKGRFEPLGELLPGEPGAVYRRCLVGDLDNDRFEDVIVVGEQASHAFRFATNGQVREVTLAAGLKDLRGRHGLLADLDFTGKLDLLSVLPEGQGLSVYRNLGNFYFKDDTTNSGLPAALAAPVSTLLPLPSVGRGPGRGQSPASPTNTPNAGLPATLTGSEQVVVEDWNNEEVPGVFVTRSAKAPLFFSKQRAGSFVETNLAPDWPAGSVVATGDLNNDLRPDLVVAGEHELSVIFGGMHQRLGLPLSGLQVKGVVLLDYDNDGWLDLLAYGNGARAWRNLGEAGFADVTATLGLDKLGPVDAIVAADFDDDGDTDLIVSSTRGLEFWRNDGGNANKQLKLRLAGNRSNASALGVRLEVTSGNWRAMRTLQQLPLEIGVGRHDKLDALKVHWFDLATTLVDVPVESKPLTLDELTLPTGSCPYLYAWDGQSFRFVTDILGASPLGLPLSQTRYIEADPEEFLALGDEQKLVPRNGNYELRVTEELREVLYLDEARLVVVDHPEGTLICPTSKLRPGKPFPPHQLRTLRPLASLKQATLTEPNAEMLKTEMLNRLVSAFQPFSLSAFQPFSSSPTPLPAPLPLDVTKLLAQTDGQMVSPPHLRKPQLRGLAEPFALTMDFGALPLDRPLVLVLTGWLRFGGGMANVAASLDDSLPFPFPELEAELPDGSWNPVQTDVGAPAGKTKTILVDLENKLPPGARRLRLTTAFEIHWDSAFLCEKAGADQNRQLSLAPNRADLHWRGFSRFAPMPDCLPLTPDYDQVQFTAPWTMTPAGWCTRYGAVDELLRESDDALVLLNGGDELALAFQARELPPKPAGFVRDFFLHVVGWDKDADFHVGQGWRVEPLPFRGMDDQAYGHQPRPAALDNAWIAKYNTRWVGPTVLSRSQR